MADLHWKENWARTRERFSAWWKREGLVLWVTASRRKPLADISVPRKPGSLEQMWIDPTYRLQKAEAEMARTYYGGEAFPYFDTHIGPGNLATFIGSEPEYAEETVWYGPCIEDPDALPPLSFDASNQHFREQMAIVERGLQCAQGRYLVGMPDLIENVDTLVSLRGMEPLIVDMSDRPSFVEERVEEINPIYFQVFDLLWQRVRDPWGGNAFSAFSIWGEGRTAKVQCDAAAALGPRQFARFVVPALARQCQWLTNSLYHLDGTQSMVHLDQLLAIDELDAIEWTVQAGRPQGGDPRWYDLYRRIRAAGKAVQAIEVSYDEVIPLLDAVGPKGLFIRTSAATEDEARALEDRVDAYR